MVRHAVLEVSLCNETSWPKSFRKQLFFKTQLQDKEIMNQTLMIVHQFPPAPACMAMGIRCSLGMGCKIDAYLHVLLADTQHRVSAPKLEIYVYSPPAAGQQASIAGLANNF